MSSSEDNDSDLDIAAPTNGTGTIQEFDSGSSYSVSEASETSESSSNLPEASQVRGRPRKRSLQENNDSSIANAKRLKTGYNYEYCKLFNETLSEIASSSNPTQNSLHPSQTGATTWSSQEKETFFSRLARKGRHNIQGIATDIGSKSESEVNVFIEQLQSAVNEEQIWELAPRKLPRTYNVDAAFEISDACCATLDLAASSLSELQYREERRCEEKKHGDLALLNPKTAKWVERCLRIGEQGEEEVLRRLPAAELLNLKMFLTLSIRVFMNSAVMDYNWRSYAKRPRSPLIMYTAFSDFYNVIVSLMKRLIQSSLFFAMSRIRALDASGQYSTKRQVRRRDVLTAIDVLGVKRDGRQVWAGTARKCKLRVFDNVRYRKVSGERYNYDEVEQILMSKPTRGRGRSLSSHKTIDLSETQQDESDWKASTDDMDNSDSSSSPSATSATSRTAAAAPASRDDSPTSNSRTHSSHSPSSSSSDRQTTYANLLDHQASLAEERRLWSLLTSSPPPQASPDPTSLPKGPRGERKDPEDLIDWSANMEHAQEWEEYGMPVPADRFRENREVGRRGSEFHKLTTTEAEGSEDSDGGESEMEQVEDKSIGSQTSQGSGGHTWVEWD